MTEKSMIQTPENFDASSSENPLINSPSMPHGAPAFSKIKTEHIEPAIDWGLKELQAEIEAIKANNGAPSFENTIEALEFAGSDLGRIFPVFHTLAGNNSDDEIRALEDVINAKTTPVFSDIAMDDVLFARIKAVYDVKDTLGLDSDQMMLLENTYKSRVRSGALLDPAKKERFKDISTELAQLTTKFSQNTVLHIASFERLATEQELKGVPERALNAYKDAAEKAGQAKDASQERKDSLKDKYLIGLQPFPSEIMSHCENRALRKEIMTASGDIGSKGKFDNRQLILDIVRLRHEAAQILGYKNHAEFVLEDRMAGSQKVVEEFLQKNIDTYKPAAKEFFDSVRDYALSKGEISDFDHHDFSFYSRQLREEKFSFDTEKLRPYFEVNKVIEGFHKHIEKLFNVEMVDCSADYDVYRDDAKAYEVRDKDTGDIVALFYTDYFADAAAKRGGAWMNDFRARALDKHGIDHIPIVTNSCNFQKPTKDQPSLLSLGEVTTIYHEGGHGFHGALAEGKYGSLNGTNVKWDFVELPSQLQENWATEKEVLDTFAFHHETGEKIPDAYIEKIKEMETYGAGYMGAMQTRNAVLDMLWHTTDPSTIASVDEIEDKAHARTLDFWPKRNGSLSPHFGHLFSGSMGYSAGYYSYKWAEVLAKDIFEAFEKNGFHDRKTAMRLLKEIYMMGGRRDEMESFRAMMGRDPDPKALFRREGLLKEDDKPAGNPPAKNIKPEQP